MSKSKTSAKKQNTKDNKMPESKILMKTLM